MSNTPIQLKEKNTNLLARSTIINSSNSKIKNSHLASHLNSNNHTPINARTKLQLGSSKIDSSKKKKTPNLTKIATLNSGTITGTPTNNRIQINSNIRSGSSSKNSFGINPLCNGVDYTEIMLKKAQFGYTGPGYIVEFDCDSKHLRGLRVEKGLWKVTTRTTNKNAEAILGIGMNYTRIDEPERCTPLKQLTNYDFTYNPKSELSGCLRKNLMSNFSNDDMNLEAKPVKSKKCFRWAENLERIEERTQNFSPNLDESNEELNNSNGSRKVAKKLRKSLSMSDINDIIAEIEKDDVTLEEVDSTKTVINDSEPNKENLNVTYDKVGQKSNAKVFNCVVHVSPAKVTNSSFLDPAINANLLQPNFSFPSLSPVKGLNETQTLSINTVANSDTLNKNKAESENQDLEKILDQFVENFKLFFSEKNEEQDDQFVLKQDLKKSINDQNKLDILLKFDQMEQMIRQFKMDIFTKAYDSNN